VAVDPIAGGLTLHSADLSASVFGDSQPNWSSSSLASVHAALNAGGISTDGKVTTLLADTDHGLALLILIDQQAAAQGTDIDGHLHMASFGNGANLAYINDPSNAVTITPNSATSRLAMGDFDWNSNGAGDGFGWANLQAGNTMTFHFDRILGQNLGLQDPRTFQFVTWNGTAWELASIPDSQASFTDSGEYGFSIVVIPLPAVAALGALPLAGLAILRRRRA
jgi:hypothetical protein